MINFRKVAGFSLVGGFVFLLGTGLLWFCVQVVHMNVYLAYMTQAVVSIESNFFLNHFFNWKEREGKLWTKWLKFHLVKVGTIVLDQVLFATFIHFGVNYLIVKVMNTGIITVFNFLLNEFYVFRMKRELPDELAKRRNCGTL